MSGIYSALEEALILSFAGARLQMNTTLYQNGPGEM